MQAHGWSSWEHVARKMRNQLNKQNVWFIYTTSELLTAIEVWEEQIFEVIFRVTYN